MLLWVRGDQGVVIGVGDTVASWSDISGNGNDLTQPNSARRPNFVASGPSGQPGVQFIATTGGGAGAALAINGLVIPAGSSVCVVFTRDAQVVGRLVDWNYPTQNMRIRPCGPALTRPAFINDGAGGGDVDGINFADGETCKILLVRDGVTVEFYQADLLSPTDTDGCTEGATTGITIGSLEATTQGVDCTIAEFIIWGRSLNASERVQLQTYLDGRYP